MRFFPVVGTLFVGSLALVVVACTGGPGPVDQGGDNGDQYGTVTAESSGNAVQVDRGSNGAVPGSSTSGNPPRSSASSTSSGTPSTPQMVSAAAFSQSCQNDSDCIAIYEGNLCTSCICGNAAIASSESQKYSSEVGTKRQQCGSIDSNPCAPCQTKQAKCNAGRCGVQ
jgi:hypothetical protein